LHAVYQIKNYIGNKMKISNAVGMR
jgi:hypothetical protein